MAKFTADEILRELDAASDAKEFPMLDNGYTYLVDVRLSAYADDARWAILIETLGVMPRAEEFDNFVYGIGNCLLQGGSRTMATFHPVDSESLFDEPSDEDDYEWEEQDPEDERWQCDLPLSADAEEFRIRERTVRVPDVREYGDRQINLEHSPHVQLHELMRFVAEDYRPLLVATEEELRTMVPSDLPLLVRLDEWWHPDLANGEKPSETETFKLLADVLASGDRKRWKPKRETNTHWSNWPDGGTL